MSQTTAVRRSGIGGSISARRRTAARDSGSAAMAKTLVTGGTGLHRHAPRPGAGGARRRAAAAGPARLRASTTSTTSTSSASTGDITDRRAVRRAMKGVDRVFHVAGTTSMRPGDRERVFEVNVGGTRNVVEEALRAGVERVVHTSSAGPRSARRSPAGPPTRASRSRAGHLGHRLHQLQARGRGRGDARRRPAAAGRRRQPDLRARPRRPERDLERAGPAGSCCARSPSTSTAG